MNKDEMKMIEEMATHMVDYCGRFQMCPYDADSNVTCDICKARSLYNANCRIIADDEIVVKKSEQKQWLKDCIESNKKTEEIARKQTAREILQEILYTKSCEEWFENEQLVDFGEKIVDKIENLAKKYGIELED